MAAENDKAGPWRRSRVLDVGVGSDFWGFLGVLRFRVSGLGRVWGFRALGFRA